MFSCEFCEIFKNIFLLNIYGQLLLHISNTNTRFRIFSNIPDEGMFIWLAHFVSQGKHAILKNQILMAIPETLLVGPKFMFSSNDI